MPFHSVLQDFFRQFHVKFSSAILLLHWECNKFCQIDGKMRNCKKISVNLTRKCKLLQLHLVTLADFLFSKLDSNTIAWPPIGRLCFCKPLGVIFHPSGLRPLGWNKTPKGCKNYSLPLGDHAILYILRQFDKKNWIWGKFPKLSIISHHHIM